jgi:hypothetical protein
LFPLSPILVLIVMVLTYMILLIDGHLKLIC